MNIPVNYVLVLAGILFTIGVLGVLIRRNAIVVFMSIELMLNAANMIFITFARSFQNLDGQVIVFFLIAAAAAEVAIGLALMVTIFRTKKSIDIDELKSLSG
ncbi:MAG: NADH-quinone oxidoreductase subunit NuoK [Anaerolineales bacterium]|nr:NADH-quinone oxidoreductase subunit NuoK [Anaerolineales bacterium]